MSRWKDRERLGINKLKKMILQVIKFGMVGIICFCVDYLILYAATEYFGLHYLLSGVISFSISVIVNYLLSSRFVFEMQKKNKGRELLIFILLSVIGLGINESIMAVFTEKHSVHYMLSKIVATIIVMAYNFISRKALLEKKSS